MRVWKDPTRPLLEVVWFRLATYKGPPPTRLSAFCSRNYSDIAYHTGVGEQRALDVAKGPKRGSRPGCDRPVWYDGHAPAGYRGDGNCGDDGAWAEGGE